MSFYKDNIYPHLVTALGDPPPIRKIRQRIVPLASGKVLEIGVGPGVNFTLYDSARVSKVYALEPNPTDRAISTRRPRESYRILAEVAPNETPIVFASDFSVSLNCVRANKSG